VVSRAGATGRDTEAEVPVTKVPTVDVTDIPKGLRSLANRRCEHVGVGLFLGD
jgi:hypothetical protein